jgi:hypothetical protein
MFSGGEKMNNIMNTSRVINDGHSGFSAAVTMRNCQYMLEKYPINDIETGLYHSSDDEPETTSIDIECPPETTKPHEYIEGKGIAFGPGIYNNMDKQNKKAADIWISKGVDDAVKYMLSGIMSGETDYASMRDRYG